MAKENSECSSEILRSRTNFSHDSDDVVVNSFFIIKQVLSARSLAFTQFWSIVQISSQPCWQEEKTVIEFLITSDNVIS